MQAVEGLGVAEKKVKINLGSFAKKKKKKVQEKKLPLYPV